MPAYVVAQSTVKDQATYQKYLAVVGPITAKFGGKVLVAGPGAKVIEGNAPYQGTAIIEFPSMDAIEKWYYSPEYSQIKKFRIDASDGWLMFAPQFIPPAH